MHDLLYMVLCTSYHGNLTEGFPIDLENKNDQ